MLAVAAAGLGLRLQAAWSSLSNLLLKTAGDDAFYYFQIARNITAGHNVTFEGENLTNGFHPLWLVILTALSFLTDDRELLLHLGLTAGALLGAATALLIFAIIKVLTGNGWAALAGATFYALHPYLIMESVNGLETALATFLFALTALLFVRLATGDAEPSPRALVLLGVSGGLMVLSRTDTLLVLPPMLVYFLLRHQGRDRWRSALVVGGSAAVVMAPWLIWMLASFGTVVQVSGVAVPDVQRQAYLSAHGDALGTQLRQSWNVTDEAFFQRIPDLYLVPDEALRLPFLLLMALAVAFMLLAPLSPQRSEARRAIGLLAVPASGVVAMLLFHTAIQWHYREWYFAPTALVFAVLLGVGVSYVESALRGTSLGWRGGQDEAATLAARRARPLDFATHRGLAVLALYGAVAAMVFTVYGPQQSDGWLPRLPHRLNMFETARWLSENTPEDARIGSFNAGILGYFSERTVINLDGVVNEDAYHARRDGLSMEYICGEEIQYLVDLELTELWLAARCRVDPCLKFELVATIGQRLPYFRGAQLDVLELVPDTTAGAPPGCALAEARRPLSHAKASRN